MTGREFHAGFLIDERGITAIRELLRVSHTHIYYLFRQEVVPEKFVERARSVGVRFPHEEIAELRAENARLKKAMSALFSTGDLK